MKCLVTGATGFLGSNLVHQFVLEGWDVRASGMHGSETKHIRGLPIEIVFADITIAEEVDPLVKGCDVVFHVASDTSSWSKTKQRQREINVEGSINVAQACMKFGVSRMVHTSTTAVLGYDPQGGCVSEENADFNCDGLCFNYGETKYQAQKALEKLNQLGLDVVYMYPGFLIGPFDHSLQLGRVLLDLKKGKMPFSPGGGASFCHATEVAKAHIQAAIRGFSGEGYICAGLPTTNMSYHDFFTKMAFVIGVKPPKIKLGTRALVIYGYLCEFVSKFTGKAPRINPGQARYMSITHYSDSRKAVRELDYVVPIAEECIRDAVDWYQDQGHKL
jgi:dihydroflavonol-4-reductase